MKRWRLLGELSRTTWPSPRYRGVRTRGQGRRGGGAFTSLRRFGSGRLIPSLARSHMLFSASKLFFLCRFPVSLKTLSFPLRCRCAQAMVITQSHSGGCLALVQGNIHKRLLSKPEKREKGPEGLSPLPGPQEARDRLLLSPDSRPRRGPLSLVLRISLDSTCIPHRAGGTRFIKNGDTFTTSSEDVRAISLSQNVSEGDRNRRDGNTESRQVVDDVGTEARLLRQPTGDARASLSTAGPSAATLC